MRNDQLQPVLMNDLELINSSSFCSMNYANFNAIFNAPQ